MALLQATLKTELLKLMDSSAIDFAGYPATVVDAATNWANAYDVYAKAAQDISTGTLATSFPLLFAAKLAAKLNPCPPGGDATSAADAFDFAFIDYWTGAIFSAGVVPLAGVAVPPAVLGTMLFSVIASSVVTAITSGVLSAALLPIFSDTVMDVDTRATQLAAAFHTATISAVNVLISGSDTTPSNIGGPYPIMNLGVPN
jgi:hypothetical protein